jgi:hypothetical protein
LSTNKQVSEKGTHLLITASDGVLNAPNTPEIRAILTEWMREPTIGIDELSIKMLRIESHLAGGAIKVSGVEPSIICPVCGLRSYNVNDIREGFCARCNDWTTVRE